MRTDNAGSSGGIDSKVTSFSRMMDGFSHAESGPTHDTQAIFQWSGSAWENQTHYGQPDVFDFGFVEMGFYEH